jgi:hypothetical protein
LDFAGVLGLLSGLIFVKLGCLSGYSIHRSAMLSLVGMTSLTNCGLNVQNEPGLEVESTNLYLQAALKFLQAAALVENDNTDINRAGETQSMVVYNDTATLCKYCAGQYERRSDMAAAALAYTCAAVALGRRMLCKNVSFARDCNELLTAAQQASAPTVTSNGPLLRPPLPSRSADKPGSSLPMVRDTGIGR